MGQVPGIAGRLERSSPVGAAQGEFVHGEFAQQDAAGGFEAGGGGGVLGRHPVNVHAGAGGGTDAGGVVEVFQGEGDAVHGAFVVSAPDLRFGDAGLLQGVVGQQQDEGMQAVVGGGDAVQAGAGQFHRGKFAPAHQFAGLMDGQEMQLGVGGSHTGFQLLGRAGFPVGGEAGLTSRPVGVELHCHFFGAEADFVELPGVGGVEGVDGLEFRDFLLAHAEAGPFRHQCELGQGYCGWFGHNHTSGFD